MPERDYTQDPDDPNNPYGRNYRGDPVQPGTPRPGGGGHGYTGSQPDLSGNDDGYGDPTDGIGSPESGYGDGGVGNPAYNTNGARKETTTPDRGHFPAAPPPPATFQPPVTADQTPSSYRPPTGAAPAAPSASVRTPPITDEVTRILMQRLKDLQNPGDVQSDPIYQRAVRANQLGLMRGAERQRAALAERMAAGGTRSSGGFNVQTRGIYERAGESGAQFAGGLALDRLSAREAQLVEGIRLARAVGQDDIANQLELQRLNLQGELGRGDLALRGELGRGQLGLGYDNLGFNYADLIIRMNRDAVLATLGGGS